MRDPFRLLATIRLWSLVLIVMACCVATSSAGELLVGGATVSITPDRPIALWGQMQTRISKGVESPLSATVLALETKASEGSPADLAVMVSCDLVAVPEETLKLTRDEVVKQLPGFPVDKIFLSATHTHTGPVLKEGVYEIPQDGVMSPTEYQQFFAERVAQGIVTAWNARQPGQVGWGMGYAVVGYNRRATYNDGTAAMYGKTGGDTFRGIEGPEDHEVGVLCFWNAAGQLIATAINVACPSQEVEGNEYINADFWHQVRESLQAEHGKELHVLGWTGAAGDQSPHLMFRKAAEDRMRKLRGNDRLKEISQRIIAAWHEAYAGATQEKLKDVPLVHHVEKLELPRREVSQREYELAKARISEMSKQSGKQTLIHWHGGVVKRYENQQAGMVAPFQMELHVIRLGDIAIATNQFELYTDYGLMMKSRSPALQTFVIQLTGPGSYLPTQRAAAGGGYSAIAESNEVGPEGGQVLVDRTVDVIKSLWNSVK
jgi:hypothetical protein